MGWRCWLLENPESGGRCRSCGGDGLEDLHIMLIENCSSCGGTGKVPAAAPLSLCEICKCYDGEHSLKCPRYGEQDEEA